MDHISCHDNNASRRRSKHNHDILMSHVSSYQINYDVVRQGSLQSDTHVGWKYYKNNWYDNIKTMFE